MILYLDTSSLVKFYIDEAHSEKVQRWIDDAEILATSRIAYPEMLSAFSRRRSEDDITDQGFQAIYSQLDTDWPNYAVLDIDEKKAGALVVKHGLRGFDAIHLEAALALQTESEHIRIAFTSFDKRLNEAATTEGLNVLSSPDYLHV